MLLGVAFCVSPAWVGQPRVASAGEFSAVLATLPENLAGAGDLGGLSLDPWGGGSVHGSSTPDARLGTHKFSLLQPEADGPPEQLGRDWAGIGRDTAFLLGYQAVVGVGARLVADGTDFSDAPKDWWDHVRHPHWDSDGPLMNYVFHPYWGAAYYTRARERGFGVLGSAVYSALMSTIFEYGVEAFFEQPSYQDLIVTPVAGTLVGAFVFEPIRTWIKRKSEMAWYDHTVMVATDPLGALNGVFEWLFGIQSEIRLQYRPASTAGRGDDRQPRQRSDEVGVRMIFRY
jgi:hypothetical protein